MKETVAFFRISEDKYIEIYIPDKENKDNYFYKPTEKWHQFDLITITYYYRDQKIDIYSGAMDAIVGLCDALISAKYTLLELPKVIEKGGMVRALNESNKDDADEVCGKYSSIDFSNFWVWSSAKQPQTFMYTIDGDIYLEIGLSYRWGRIDDDALDYKLYEEFMKSYKPIAVELIPPAVADRWLEQCKELTKILDQTLIESREGLFPT